MSAFGGKADFA